MLTGDTRHRPPASACSTCEHTSLDTGMFLKSDYRGKKCAKKELRVQLLKSRSPRLHSDTEPRLSGMNLEGCPHSTQSVAPARIFVTLFPWKTTLSGPRPSGTHIERQSSSQSSNFLTGVFGNLPLPERIGWEGRTGVLSLVVTPTLHSTTHTLFLQRPGHHSKSPGN